MTDDLKRIVLVTWFMGPWLAIIWWIVTIKPPVGLWVPVAVVWFIVWIRYGNILTVRFFPEAFPEYAKRKQGKRKK